MNAEQRRVFDISRPVTAQTAGWPGDPPLEVEWLTRTANGDSSNLSRISTGLHIGTHADAPFHVLEDGAGVGELSLHPFIGPALLVELP